jgi:hypothetical protein
MNMKRFIVEQLGFVQVEAERRFLLEVPDDCTLEEAAELLEGVSESSLDGEGMEWTDNNDQNWLGFNVQIDTTEVYDPDTVAGAPPTEGLKVIMLGDNK